MPTTDTVVIGAGHAGLAVSRLLTAAGHDHVVLDRGRVAERWRTERWDSLRLLTPSWMTRLPGWHYTGPDPEGFMPVGRLVHHLEQYAGSFDAPVQTSTTVERVTSGRSGYLVCTDRGTWSARHVVVATGPWGRPRVPRSVRPSPDIEVVTASSYRNPTGLPPGGVLVVGASSSGVQIADELSRSGRRVLLAVGRHTRMPRRYRGMDVFWWLERTGRLARTIDEVPDPAAARREPSLQLVGRPAPDHGDDLDLGTLLRQGVGLLGRLERIDGRRTTFRQDLAVTTADADRRMNRFLDAVDEHVDSTGLTREVWPGTRPRPISPPPSPTRLDLRGAGVSTILLATGYVPDHAWLRLPVLAADGSIRQRRGVTPAPGVYVVGQRFQHRRDAGFIDGARHDAHAVVAHITAGGQVPAGSCPEAEVDPR